MPMSVSWASAWLADFLTPLAPSAISTRSSAAPSGVSRRTAPSTRTVEIKDSISAGSRWLSTYGIPMQVEVSISARSGSPDSTPAHRLDSIRWTNSLASLRSGALAVPALARAPLMAALAASSFPAGVTALATRALFAAALLMGALRRDRVFLLTAQSYGAPLTFSPCALAGGAEAAARERRGRPPRRPPPPWRARWRAARPRGRPRETGATGPHAALAAHDGTGGELIGHDGTAQPQRRPRDRHPAARHP